MVAREIYLIYKVKWMPEFCFSYWVTMPSSCVWWWCLGKLGLLTNMMSFSSSSADIYSTSSLLFSLWHDMTIHTYKYMTHIYAYIHVCSAIAITLSIRLSNSRLPLVFKLIIVPTALVLTSCNATGQLLHVRTMFLLLTLFFSWIYRR